MAEPPLPKSKVPRVLSHYRLGKVLGSGGMGTFYRATDRRDDSTVAIKLLHPHLAGDETFRERFEREAHVGALLRSPYTVHLLDYGFAGGYHFIVMEYVEGQTVKEALQGGPLEVRRALHIGAQVARALEEAGARGVVHRDIKPENVLLGPGDSVKVSDFGIARQAGRATLTVAGGFVGTLAYAAPELALGKADHRSDIYSLGATLYHVLTGRPPFSGDILEILRHHRETPLSLEPLAGLPAAVTEVVRRCLEKDPERRYQAASALAGALEHALRPEEPSTTVAAVETPATTEIEATKPIEATELAATAALGTAVTLELGPSKAGRPFGARLSSTYYGLTLRNDSDESVELQLAAEDSEGRCSFSLPDKVSVPARGTTTVNLKVRPRQRRWRGGRETRQFAVSASGGGGQPPFTITGRFDDMSYGWLPYGGSLFAVSGAGVAVGLALLVPLGGGGGSTPSTTRPSPTAGAEEVIPAPTPEPTPPPAPETPRRGSDTAEIIMMIPGIQFDRQQLVVSADMDVTITADDTDGTHNFAVYAGDPRVGGVLIDETEICSAPCTDTLTLNLPAGEYLYRCEVHPSTRYNMTGTLIVQ